jgi:hypothetical protein
MPCSQHPPALNDALFTPQGIPVCGAAAGFAPGCQVPAVAAAARVADVHLVVVPLVVARLQLTHFEILCQNWALLGGVCVLKWRHAKALRPEGGQAGVETHIDKEGGQVRAAV